MPAILSTGTPSYEEFSKQFVVKNFAQDWTSYFDEYSVIKAVTNSVARFFELASRSKPPEAAMLDPKHIDHCCSMDDGVWYPDAMQPCIGWQGGNFSLDNRGGYFNPFMIDHEHRVKALHFTPILHHPELREYAVQCGFDYTSSDRGNQAIANQSSKPTTWTKSQFLTLGALRAYPFQQFRKLCVALHDDLLPWDSDDVSVLLRLVLFHVGELSANSPSRMLWKEELFHRGLQNFEMVIRTRMVEIREKPRDHKSLLLLAELATFGAQWSSSCRSLARDIAKVAMGWVDDLTRRETELVDSRTFAPVGELQDTRSKRSLLSMYAIVCHERGEKLTFV